VQLFDPYYLRSSERGITIDLVARLAEIKPLEEEAGLMARLQRDLPIHIAAANGFSIDHGDAGDFTKEILSWWNSHASEVGAWSEAARIDFAMAPNSARAGRVFRFLLSCSEATKTIPFPTTFAGQWFFATTAPSALMKLANKTKLGR
jgi:hypothetical protein